MKEKIIHILAGKANPNTLNGVNKVVDALATEQTKLGFDVTVVGIADNTIKRHEPIYKYVLFKKRVFGLSFPPDLLKYLFENSDNNTKFHLHSVFIPWYRSLSKKLIKSGRIHIFYTPHGALIEEGMNSLKKRFFFNFFDRCVIKNCEAVHIIGYMTENNKYIKPYAKRIVVIPNGFGGQSIPSFSEPELPIIGYLGRLDCYQKGLDILIPAFAKYKRESGIGILKIAGGGKDESKIRDKINKEQINDFVELVGVLYNEEKWNFLGSCAAHIAPSRFDVLPTACLESAAVGCIQLVDDATNMSVYIHKYNAGITTEDLSIDSISMLLHRFDLVFKDKLLYSSMRNGAKQMIHEELNWSAISMKMIRELYNT